MRRGRVLLLQYTEKGGGGLQGAACELDQTQMVTLAGGI